MSWANRLLAVVNTFTGRPTPTTKDPAYLVSSALVNANFQADMLAVAFARRLVQSALIIRAPISSAS